MAFQAAACKQNGESLRYVKNQTNEICLAVCKQNGESLRYVENQTNEICLAACKQTIFSLMYGKNEKTQDSKIRLKIARQYNKVLLFVKDPILNLCLSKYIKFIVRKGYTI